MIVEGDFEQKETKGTKVWGGDREVWQNDPAYALRGYGGHVQPTPFVATADRLWAK